MWEGPATFRCVAKCRDASLFPSPQRGQPGKVCPHEHRLPPQTSTTPALPSSCGTESGLAQVTSISSSASEAAGNGDASIAPTAAHETAAPAAAAPAESEAPKPAPSTADTSVAREYKNALRSAESYLRMSGFSYQGLYEQLTSEYGEGYPPEAAQYALDNVKVDWNEQALKSAQSYQKLMPMSDSELFEQLTSVYGEQFTAEQAQYAIDHLDG